MNATECREKHGIMQKVANSKRRRVPRYVHCLFYTQW